MKVVLPKLGLTMTEAEVGTWHVQVGTRVSQGDVLVEIAMDKADVEVEAPASGVMIAIHAEEGAIVEVGSTLAEMEVEAEAEPDSAATSSSEEASTSEATDVEIGGTDDRARTPTAGTAGETAESGDAAIAIATSAIVEPALAGDGKSSSGPAAGVSRPPEGQRRPISSPRARRLASETGVDMTTLQGTGPGGRVVSRDVTSRAAAAVKEVAPPTVSAPVSSPASRDHSGRVSATRVLAVPQGALELTRERWLALWVSTGVYALRRTALIPGPPNDVMATLQFGARLEDRLFVTDLADLNVLGVARRLSSALPATPKDRDGQASPPQLHVIDLGQSGLDELDAEREEAPITLVIGQPTAGVQVSTGVSGPSIHIQQSVRVKISCDGTGPGRGSVLVAAFEKMVEALIPAAQQLSQAP